MLSLVFWWIAGVLVRFLFGWALDPEFNVKSNLKRVILSVVIGIAPAYILFKMGMTNWTAYILLLVAGFLSQYALEWLNKRKG